MGSRKEKSAFAAATEREGEKGGEKQNDIAAASVRYCYENFFGLHYRTYT